MKRTAAALLILVLLIFSACGAKQTSEGSIENYGNYDEQVINRNVPSFTLGEYGDFSILQFSDTHFISGTTKKDVKTLTAVREAVARYKPELVVITGDMVEGENRDAKYNKKNAIQTIATLFEELKQYWAYVPGNNDGEVFGTARDVATLLSEYEHCILSNVPELTGATQYAVDLYAQNGENKRLVHSLLFLDSLARDENNEYDFIKSEQVQWAADKIAEKQKQNADVTVSMFFHMNTPNFANAGKSGRGYAGDYHPIPSDFYTGIDGNYRLDSVTEESGAVGLVSIGHLHPQTNYCSLYRETYYHVVKASGYAATKNPGAALITIHTKETQKSSMYDFEEIDF